MKGLIFHDPGIRWSVVASQQGNTRKECFGLSHQGRRDGLPLPSTKIKKSTEVRKYPEPGAFSDEKKELVIPERDTDTSEMYAYLTGRGISPVFLGRDPV